MRTPPRALQALLASCLPEGRRETVLGDLNEEYVSQSVLGIPRTASLWYLMTGLSVALYYAVEGLTSPHGMRTDLRAAWHRMVANPGTVAVAVAGIGIAVGANAATLSLANEVFLTPLPFPSGERLGLLTYDFEGSETDEFGISHHDLATAEANTTAFEQIVPVMDWPYVDFEDHDGLRRIPASFLGRDYAEMLGVEPVLGRLFTETEEESGSGSAGSTAVLLSRTFWIRELGGRPDVVGATVELNGAPATVVGVIPGWNHDLRQRFGPRADVYVPLLAAEELLGRPLGVDRGEGPLNALVRLRPDASFEDARRELVHVSEALASDFPATNGGWTLHLEPLEEVFYRDARPTVLILLAGSALVFLLVAFNLVGLVLIRALGRRQEASVRLALGAAPGRLLRLSLAEALLISAFGAVLGLALAKAGSRFLESSALLDLPSFTAVGLGAEAVAVTLTALVALTIVLGWAGWRPLGRAGRMPGAARSTRHGGADHRTRRARSLLVVGEVAVAFTLLVVGGLLVRSSTTLRRADVGFRAERLLTVKFELRDDRYGAPESRRALAEGLVDGASGIQGVEDAFLWSPNGIGEGSWVDLVTREGHWDDHPDERVEASRHQVLPGTLERAGIEIVEGRDFRPSDHAESRPVALVSASLARRLWPDGTSVGRSLESRLGGELTVRRVVGVVEDARHRDRLTELLGPQLDVYYPFAQRSEAHISLAVRLVAGTPPSSVLPKLRETIADLDPALPLYGTSVIADRVRERTARARLTTWFVVGYSVIAALLAALGVYGILAEAVRDRTREIGVRRALGAGTRGLVVKVVARALLALAPGMVVGAALVAGGSRLVERALYGVSVWDPVALVSATFCLVLVGLGASIRPALQARSVDPARILREG